MVKLRRAAAPDLPDVLSSDGDDSGSSEDGSWDTSEEEGSELSDVQEEGTEDDQDNGSQAASSEEEDVQQGQQNDSSSSDAMSESLCEWFEASTGSAELEQEHGQLSTAGRMPPASLLPADDDADAPAVAAAALSAEALEQHEPCTLAISLNPFTALDDAWSNSTDTVAQLQLDDSLDADALLQQQRQQHEEDEQEQEDTQLLHEPVFSRNAVYSPGDADDMPQCEIDAAIDQHLNEREVAARVHETARSYGYIAHTLQQWLWQQQHPQQQQQHEEEEQGHSPAEGETAAAATAAVATVAAASRLEHAQDLSFAERRLLAQHRRQWAVTQHAAAAREQQHTEHALSAVQQQGLHSSLAAEEQSSAELQLFGLPDPPPMLSSGSRSSSNSSLPSLSHWSGVSEAEARSPHSALPVGPAAAGAARLAMARTGAMPPPMPDGDAWSAAAQAQDGSMHDSAQRTQRAAATLTGAAAEADGLVDVQLSWQEHAAEQAMLQLLQQEADEGAAQAVVPRQPMLQLRNGMGLGMRSAGVFVQEEAAQAQGATNPEATDSSQQGTSHECWVCFSSGPGLFSPCATCSGSLSHIHRDCFRQWLSASWGMSCPNCARRYAPEVLSQFEDGRLLLTLLEQQREQGHVSATAAVAASSNAREAAWEPDVPYPPYSVAHFTVGGHFQVTISAENQTPAGLLRSIRSVVESLAADPPVRADGTRVALSSAQIGALVIEQQQPPHPSRNHGSWYPDGDSADGEDEGSEGSAYDELSQLYLNQEGLQLDARLRGATGGPHAGGHALLHHNWDPWEYAWQRPIVHMPRNGGHHGWDVHGGGAMQQRQGDRGGGAPAESGLRGRRRQEPRQAAAVRQMERRTNVGRRHANAGLRTMARGQRNR